MLKDENFFRDILDPKTILFIGSGVSNWSGLPSWENLSYKILDLAINKKSISKNEYKDIKNKIRERDYISAISYCTKKINIESLHKFLRSEFGEKNSPHKLHEVLVKLGPKCFITTNYDKLIEQAYFKINKKKLNIVTNTNPIEQSKIQSIKASDFIFKPHGCVSSVETIILSREDYRKLVHSNRSTFETYKHLLIQRPVVFIGFGVNDPDFILIKDLLKEVYLDCQSNHYALMPFCDRLEEDYLTKELGIKVIKYSQKPKGEKLTGYQLLLPFIESIAVKKQKQDTEEEKHISQTKSLERYCHTLNFEIEKIIEKEIYEVEGRFEENALDNKNGFRHRGINNCGIDEILKQSTRLIITGKPGIGKTQVLLKYAYSKNKELLNDIANVKQYSVQIYLPFKEYNGNIIRMLEQRFAKDNEIQALLKKGFCTLIFDAINEAPRQFIESNQVTRDINKFINDYTLNKFIISIRENHTFKQPSFSSYEITGLHLNTITAEFKRKEINYSDIPYELTKSLKVPFIFRQFVNSNITKSENLKNTRSLLEQYFTNIETKMNVHGFKIDLRTTFCNLGYHLIQKGSLVCTEKTLFSFVAFSGVSQIRLLNLLHQFRFFEFDHLGNVSFSHQIVLEYLASFKLSKLIQQDKKAINKVLQHKNWDEVLILAATSANNRTRKVIIESLIQKDLLYAFTVYDRATINDISIEKKLFDSLFNRLGGDLKFTMDKSSVNVLLKKSKLSKRYKNHLLLLLEDDRLSQSAAVALARMGATEVVKYCINRLVDGPHGDVASYAKALIIISNNRITELLLDRIHHTESLYKHELSCNYIGWVLNTYSQKSSKLLIQNYINSKNNHNVILGLNLIKGFDDNFKKRILEQAIKKHGNSVIILKAIMNSCKSFGYIGVNNNLNSHLINDKLSKLIGNKSIGHLIVEFFLILKDEAILKYYKDIDLTGRISYKKINLAILFYHFKKDQESKKTILIAIEKYKQSYFNALYNDYLFDLDKILLEADLSFLRTNKDQQLDKIIVKRLHNKLLIYEYRTLPKKFFLRVAKSFEVYINNYDKCTKEEHFYFQYYLTGFLIHSFDVVGQNILYKINDSNNKYRALLFTLIPDEYIRIDLFTKETIEYLINALKRDYYYLHSILGNFTDTVFVKERLLPLLKSQDENVKRNAYRVIKKIEAKTQKRFIPY